MFFTYSIFRDSELKKSAIKSINSSATQGSPEIIDSESSLTSSTASSPIVTAPATSSPVSTPAPVSSASRLDAIVAALKSTAEAANSSSRAEGSKEISDVGADKDRSEAPVLDQSEVIVVLESPVVDKTEATTRSESLISDQTKVASVPEKTEVLKTNEIISAERAKTCEQIMLDQITSEPLVVNDQTDEVTNNERSVTKSTTSNDAEKALTSSPSKKTKKNKEDKLSPSKHKASSKIP